MQVTGSKSSIGTSPVALVAASTKISAQVTVLADAGNSSTTYLDFSNAITPGTTDATDGFPLAAAATLTLSPAQVAGDLANVFAVAGGGSQKLHFIGS